MRLAKELASLALIISIDVLWPGNSAINTWESTNDDLINAPCIDQVQRTGSSDFRCCTWSVA